MTKLQLSFPLLRPLDEDLMCRVGAVTSTYGILGVRAEPGSDRLTVEYDATRFSPRDVEAVLARAGLPLAVRSV
jgi:hypothetical protein